MDGCILLAEDDVEMNRLLTEALRHDGYHVVNAANGRELMARIAGLRDQMDSGRFFDVDLIISDVRMPHVSGMEVLRRLRAVDHATPVILITAFGDERTHAEAHRLGAAILDKPFDLNDFQELVRARMPVREFKTHASYWQ